MGEWYKSWFEDERYLCLYDKRNDAEASMMIDLIERVTGDDKSRSVLDVPCGAGRHLITLAERGYTNLHGIDISHTLLAVGEKRAKESNISIDFKQGDIRAPFGASYDVILNLFTSFGYFDSDDEHQTVINSFANALNPHGYCVIDFFNVKCVVQTLVAEDEKIMPTGEHVKMKRHIENGRVIKNIFFVEDDKEFIESVRLFQLDDFHAMLTKAGLKMENTFGNYDGSVFDENSSPRLIIFARKYV